MHSRRRSPGWLIAAAAVAIGAIGVAFSATASAEEAFSWGETDNYTPVDSQPVKSVTSGCPTGLVVFGTDPIAVDANSQRLAADQVVVEEAIAEAGHASFTVRVVDPAVGDWSLIGHIYCMAPGDATVRTAEGKDGTAKARCPRGTVAIGSGFRAASGATINADPTIDPRKVVDQVLGSSAGRRAALRSARFTVSATPSDTLQATVTCVAPNRLHRPESGNS